MSQVLHLRMSGFLLSASFLPKPHAEADIKTTAKPLTRFIEKKGWERECKWGGGERRKEEGKNVWMYKRFRNAGKILTM